MNSFGQGRPTATGRKFHKGEGHCVAEHQLGLSTQWFERRAPNTATRRSAQRLVLAVSTSVLKRRTFHICLHAALAASCLWTVVFCLLFPPHTALATTRRRIVPWLMVCVCPVRAGPEFRPECGGQRPAWYGVRVARFGLFLLGTYACHTQILLA